jgi:tetratricopeptide (TPR) repeat protein
MKTHIVCALALTLSFNSSQAQVDYFAVSLNATEAFNKGMVYSSSGLVIKDMEKAKTFFQQAVDLGSSKAKFQLGKAYALEQNSESRIKAIFYFEQAAQDGITDAWTELGNLFYQTTLLHQNYMKAFAYFKKGAELKNNDCLATVGYFYFKGLNNDQDYLKAFEYFTRAAEKNHPMALYFLGLQYRNGYGVSRNVTLARTLLTQSANLNHFQAKHELTVPDPENPIEALNPPAILRLDYVNGFQRIKHNMQANSIIGDYKGYAIRYDFSGRNILSVFPLELTLKTIGDKVEGTWKEEGIVTNINAKCTENGLIFSNTSYNKVDHYSAFRGGEIWQFNNAKLNLLQETDSTYINGNVQLYSTIRKEPGLPFYVTLTRATSKKEIDNLISNGLTLSCNSPFENNIQVTFEVKQKSQVALKLITQQGLQIFTQNAGILPAGTYTRNFNMARNLAGGSYVLQIETNAGNKSIVIVKQ